MTEEQNKIIKYLKTAFYMEKKINALISLKSRNEAIACKCTAKYEKIPHHQSTSGKSNTDTVIHKIIDIDIQISAEIDKLVDIRADIFKAIKSLENPDLEAVLINRYLNYFTLDKTAEVMHYSLASVKNKHNSAIKRLAEIILI